MKVSLGYWFYRLRSAWRWYRSARTRFDVHSPFLAEFIREVWRDDRYYAAFGKIRRVRKSWAAERGSRVKLLQLGAPSRTTRRAHRSPAALVATNAVGERSGRLLFRLALWLRAARILEFGTNVGISTLYLHAADTRAELRTVEGNPAVAALARRTFQRFGASPRLQPACARFGDWLDEQLPCLPVQDLIFIDGDHRYGPTLDYVRRLLPHTTARSVVVVADIYWSAGMERAWAELRSWPEFTASVDVYHFGILFRRPELSGPHTALIRTRFKPWRVGFW